MQTLLVHLGARNYKDNHLDPIENTGFIKLESDGVDFFVKEVKTKN